MPGFDGTGPMGMGPMTGGGRGFCAVPYRPAWRRYASVRGYRPYAPFYSMSFIPRMSSEQEIEFLKTQAQDLREQLEEVQARVTELEKES